MANTYKYGTYADIGESVARNAVQSGTVTVYFGTAPINLIHGYKDLNVINNPVMLTNGVEAYRKFGNSINWKDFTLCEAFSAHFNNNMGNIGPIYVINVLDPDIHRKLSQTTITVNFLNGRAEFKSDKIIIDTLLIEDLVNDVDFSIDYNFTKNSVIIKNLNEENPLTGQVQVTFYEIDTSLITYEDIIGGISSSGEYFGIGALQLLYQEQNAVANILVAPGWSEIPAVYNALISASQKINGHWDAFVMADIPIEKNGEKIDSIDKAKNWKTMNGYSSERSKTYWPQVIDNLKNIYHLSTLATVEMLRYDFSHNSVPIETPGNKEIKISKLFFGENNKNKGYDQQTANQLTSVGISTAVYWGGRWVLWGDHTSAYTYGADIDPRVIFDVSMRMLFHCTNGFQREWGIKIDKPFTRQLKDTIINKEQEKLDILVSVGALIGKPTISFLEINNPITDMMNGDFRWDMQITPTPPFKSATICLTYTDEGFSSYFEGGSQ